MGFSLKNIFKGAAVAATGFVASKYLGPVGGKLVSRVAGGLMGGDSGQGGGGNWQPIDTSVSPQSYGGRMGFERSDSAGEVNSIKTANAEQLRDEWDYRLTKWFRNQDSTLT
jgi:hypothetical protein